MNGYLNSILFDGNISSQEKKESLKLKLKDCIENGRSLLLHSNTLHKEAILSLNSFLKKNPEIQKKWEEYPSIGFFSSGSTGLSKLILHHPSSLLTSAKVSGELLGLKEEDQIHSSLPAFHMGGLLNFLREDLFNVKLNTVKDTKELHPKKGDFVIGVPAQLHSLLDKTSFDEFTFYSGGDHVSHHTLVLAQKRRINLIETYGLTESCGAILYQLPLEDGNIHKMPDTITKINSEHLLCFKNGRLPLAIIDHSKGQVLWEKESLDPEGFFITQDLAEETQNQGLKILGRKDGIIISGGENINPYVVLEKIQKEFLSHEISYQSIKLLAVEHKRLGKVLTLFLGTDLAQFEKAKTLLRGSTALDRPRFLIPYPKALGIKPTLKDFLQNFEDFREEGNL